MIRRPPKPPLFPYTPLSRSGQLVAEPIRAVVPALAADLGDREVGPLRELAGHQPTGQLRVDHHRPILSACRSEEHTSELQSRQYLVCRLLLEKKKHRNLVHY